MPIRTFDIPEELDQFISQSIANGRYRDADELMTAALLNLRCEENDYQEKFSSLKAAIEEGLNGDIVEGDIFEQVRAELGLPLKKSA
jgi:putative addiction module CopG family antidote